MIGFTIPLLIWLAVLSSLGLALLSGPPLSRVAASICRASYSSQGRTITYTIAAMLCVLLLNPMWDGYQLWAAAGRGDEDKALAHEQARRAAAGAERELSTLLSGVLLLASTFGLFFIRRLGQAVADCERMAISEQALLRQVKNMQASFVGGSAAAGSATAPPAKEQQPTAAAAELQREAEQARAAAAAAQRAQRQAETNLSALKTQCRGLENEYDRLAAENQQLLRRLQRAGLEPAPGGSGGGGALGKKDE